MSLPKGRKLAHYEIAEPIGKGGMGEVYRAKDSKLGRDVAIKILPEEFSSDHERLARFKREAKVLASLNHPNIGAIYGLEQSDKTHYLVLELVEGETLAERIARGPIALDETVAIATKITHALERAHEQGIVHRDLKPANVKLTPDDDVKVLDFGLAKAFVEDAVDGDSSMSPTITRDATRVGVILGTAAYMSPEQAKGKRVDRRTDVFAFGAVLFEMLSGRKAFAGQDVSDVLASVLKLEPDWSALPASVPSRLRETLQRCLEKDPANRRRDIGDVRIDIREAMNIVEPGPPPARFWQYAAAVAGVAVVTGFALGWLFRGASPGTTTTNDWRFLVDVGPGLYLDRPTDANIALSHDGAMLAYAVYNGATSQEIHIRRMNELDPRPVTGTESAKNPFFSPDGNWLAYFTFPNDTLAKVSLNGGAPIRIASADFFWGGSWGVDDNIYYSSRGIVYRVAASGGSEPEVLLEPGSPPAAAAYRFPEVVPTGNALLVTANGDPRDFDESYIVMLELESGELRTLIERGSHARYVRTGHLVFVRDGSLMAVAFDLDRRTVVGTPVAVVAETSFTPDSGGGQYDISRDGALAYVPPGPQAPSSRIFWRHRNGAIDAPLLTIENVQALRLSPDESSVAISAESTWPHLYLFDLRREILARVTTELSPSVFEIYPAWTTDGRRLTFAAPDGQGLFEPRSIPADRSGPSELLPGAESDTHPYAWTRDGKTLLYTQPTTEQGSNIGMLFPESAEAKDLLSSEANETEPALSPDDTWLAYVSDESGRREVYVQPFPDLGAKLKISADGGWSPLWSRNGREIFYRDGENLMVVAVDANDGFSAGRPEALFEDTVPAWMDGGYDVSADGQRFLTMETLPDGANKIVFVPNWFRELERLVPSTRGE